MTRPTTDGPRYGRIDRDDALRLAFMAVATDRPRALAAVHFDGTIEVGDDLHRVEIHPT